MKIKNHETTKKSLIIFLVFLLQSCIVNVPLGRFREPLEEVTVLGTGRDKIVLINISGVISWDRRGRGLFGEDEPSIVSRIKEELDKARQDTKVKGVLLKVESPGGLISASEIIYQEIKKFKQEKKIPIVSYISSLGASGAYYVIMPSDKIIASPGSTVGSIGVYMIKVNLKELSDKVGVQIEVIKAGKYKDALLPHRGLTDEERLKIQSMINYYYESFKRVVVEGRKGKLRKSIDEISDGSVFTPAEAVELGIIDDIGDLYYAIEELAKMAGTRDYRIVAYTRGGRNLNSIWDETYSNQKITEFLNLLTEGIHIFYLYPAEM